MSTWSDLMQSLNSDCLEHLGGVGVSYFYPGEDGFAISGIFRTEQRPEGLSPGTLPALFVNLSDFDSHSPITRDDPRPAIADTIEFESKRYTITDVQADGQGGANLFLQKRADL